LGVALVILSSAAFCFMPVLIEIGNRSLLRSIIRRIVRSIQPQIRGRCELAQGWSSPEIANADASGQS
jgi:hypothetical protein